MIVKNLKDSFNPVPKNERIVNKKLLKDKKGICQICHQKGQTEKHHIKTKGSGGNDTEDNLIELCRKCHILCHNGVFTKEELKKIINKKPTKHIERLDKFIK